MSLITMLLACLLPPLIAVELNEDSILAEWPFRGDTSHDSDVPQCVATAIVKQADIYLIFVNQHYFLDLVETLFPFW